MSVVDCRGLACPEPVTVTKEALDQLQEGELIVVVNNTVSLNNVERFARSQGCSVEIKEVDKDYHVYIRKGGRKDEKAEIQPGKGKEKIVVYINSNLLGIGEETLGAVLMRTFLKTLLDLPVKPYRLIFINTGVRLTSEGSEALTTLRALSETGVEILSCGTCLDFYRLTEKLKVGVISNMFDIAQTLFEADRLIRP
jgi:selenium metabolism protein YedF